MLLSLILYHCLFPKTVTSVKSLSSLSQTQFVKVKVSILFCMVLSVPRVKRLL